MNVRQGAVATRRVHYCPSKYSPTHFAVFLGAHSICKKSGMRSTVVRALRCPMHIVTIAKEKNGRYRSPTNALAWSYLYNFFQGFSAEREHDHAHGVWLTYLHVFAPTSIQSQAREYSGFRFIVIHQEVGLHSYSGLPRNGQSNAYSESGLPFYQCKSNAPC